MRPMFGTSGVTARSYWKYMKSFISPWCSARRVEMPAMRPVVHRDGPDRMVYRPPSSIISRQSSFRGNHVVAPRASPAGPKWHWR